MLWYILKLVERWQNLDLFERKSRQNKRWKLVGWLCWGLTSQSTIFQSYRDGAIASWVINQYFRGVKCLAQGHNTAAVGLEPRTSRSGVRHSTTEPPRSPKKDGSVNLLNSVATRIVFILPNRLINLITHACLCKIFIYVFMWDVRSNIKFLNKGLLKFEFEK